MKPDKKRFSPWIFSAAFGIFILASWLTGFEPGKEVGGNFATFSIHLLKILPCLFILIGLFDVWIKTETIEKHLGHGAGHWSYLWAVLLAGTTVGGLHVGLPVAHALYVKRARLGVVLTYLFCGSICRIPMTLFEATFLGWRFTAIRFAISLPLVIITSALLGRHLDRNHYRLPNTPH